MKKILDFFSAYGAKCRVNEGLAASSQRVEYLRQLVGAELYNRAAGMPIGDALAALELIRQDVERHAITGGRIA